MTDSSEDRRKIAAMLRAKVQGQSTEHAAGVRYAASLVEKWDAATETKATSRFAEMTPCPYCGHDTAEGRSVDGMDVTVWCCARCLTITKDEWSAQKAVEAKRLVGRSDDE